MGIRLSQVQNSRGTTLGAYLKLAADCAAPVLIIQYGRAI